MNKNIQNAVKYAALGVEFGSIVLGIAWIGNYFDKKISTTPLFTIIGIFLGFISGIYRLYKISKIINK